MKGMEMMKRIYQRIFGVPSDRVQAVEVTQRPIEGEFKPESELTSQQINGTADGGTRWAFWRSDPDGQRWFKRVAADSPSPTIQAADDCEDLPADSGVQFDAIEKLRRESAIIKAKYLRGEIGDYGSEWTGDVSDED